MPEKRTEPPSKPPKRRSKETEVRLAEALRRNLSRRKTQSRNRSGGDSPEHSK